MNATATVIRALKLARVAKAGRAVRNAADASSRRAARRALANVLADARGVPMKVGQLLAATGADDDLRQLVEGIEPMPWRDIRPHLQACLGQPMFSVFSALSERGIAASLGQVHEGTLLDGRHVAAKVQYPDIESAVDAELQIAGWLPGMGPVKLWGFDLAGYKRMLRENMRRELDYSDEAARQTRFRDAVHVKGLVVPEVIQAHPRLLIQSWQSGVPLRDARAWERKARLQAARTLMATLLASFFVAGITHGDPHPGNYRFRLDEAGDAEVVLLDYGCTIEIETGVRRALLAWIVATREARPVPHLELLVEMGFQEEKLRPIEQALPELSRLLLAPFLARGPFAIRSWGLREQMDELLGELRWWFRAAGPPNLLLLMRAFHGLALQLDELDTELPWWPVLVHAVGPEALENARNYRPTGDVVRGSPTITPRASLLKVRVERRGRQPIALSLPAEEARDLEGLIPADVRARMRKHAIDLAAIQRDVLRRGLAPQTLFEISEDDERIKVWLQ